MNLYKFSKLVQVKCKLKIISNQKTLRLLLHRLSASTEFNDHW